MRPRINDETEELLRELDQRLFELRDDMTPDELVSKVEGRGSGNNHYTHSSLIYTALKYFEARVEVSEELEKAAKGDDSAKLEVPLK